jgi:cell division protein FtsN
MQRQATHLIGFAFGMVTGLAIAVGIALYLTNSPVPFVNKVQRSTENITPEDTDPNRPLFSPQIPSAAPPLPDSAAPAAPAPGDAKEGAAAVRPAPEANPPSAASGDAAAGVPMTAAPGAGADKPGDGSADSGARLMLQVGAYRSAEDADAIRARLALLGLDAKVTSIEADGAPLYRVRLGPYGQLDDLNGIRRTLSENGMEPQLVHAR